MSKNKVAIVTGANAGIGYSLVKQLLQKHHNLEVCMICRNKYKAFSAQRDLQNEFHNRSIDVMFADMCDPQSVIQVAQEVKLKYDHVDYLYMNAGIMPEPIVDWNYFLKNIFSSNCIEMFYTGHGLLKQVDNEKDNGLCGIFSTNVFGHFILFKELLSILGRSKERNTTQIVWTSSSNAKRSAFNLENIQHRNGDEPYSSSKYVIDLLSYQINKEFNKNGIYSHTTCPGLVMTNLLYGIIGSWFWYIILPILSLFRIFVSSLTLKPEIAAYSLCWLSSQDPESLDPGSKFYTRSTVFGKAYVWYSKMDLDPHLASNTYKKIEKILGQYRTTGRVED